MSERTEGRPTDGLSVLVIDEDKHHANSARSMLCKLNFYGKCHLFLSVTTAYDNLEVVRYEDENACKEHELIFGNQDSSILPSPTLPTQFCGQYQGYFQ